MLPSRPLMFAGQNVTNGEVPLQDLTRKKGKKKMYDPKSLKAEEFICHDEVMDSLGLRRRKQRQQGTDPSNPG